MNAKDYPEDFPDKLDYALHTLSPTQRAAFESWASKQEREDAEADAAALSEVFGTSLTPLEPSVEGWGVHDRYRHAVDFPLSH